MRPQLLNRPQYFDARVYALCKPFLRSKDHWLGRQIGAELRDRIRRSERVRLLDVGTGEGVILREAIRMVMEDDIDAAARLSVICLEPERLYRPSMESLVEKLGAGGVHCSFLSETLEQYLDESSGERFDVVTATHTMYHFARSSWPAIVGGLQSMLDKAGVLVVQLVSRDSTVQHLGQSVVAEAARIGVGRRFDVTGLDICAEDFAEDLLAHGFIADDVRTPAAPLAVTPADYAATIRAIDNRSWQAPPFLEFLAFMLRLPADALRNELHDATVSLIRAMREEHPPMTIDGVITVCGDKR